MKSISDVIEFINPVPKTKGRGRQKQDLITRFWSKVNKTKSCWIWSGTITPSGYGYLNIKQKNIRAHRAVLILNGIEIPEGLVVDHLCKNRICVNPEHLRIVTVAVNALENSDCPTAINNNKSHCINGHELNVKNTRRSQRKNGKLRRTCRICCKIRARRYRLKI